MFDRKLSFYNYIDFHANKVISTVKCMKILGNSTRGLNPNQKCLLYRSCAIPITLYSFQLWHYNRAPLSYSLKILNKIQRKAALWIVGAFKTSSSLGIKAIAGLIPINLHLIKIGGRSQLRVHALPSNHILYTLIGYNFISPSYQHALLLISLMRRQQNLIKDHIVNMDNHFNKVFPSFNPINPEFSPSNRIIDTHTKHFLSISLTSILATISSLVFKNLTK